MAASNVIVGLSIVSGVMASLLIVFSLFFEKNKKKSRTLLLWGVLFLASSVGTAEYALWLENFDLFQSILIFNFPLIVYFAVWFLFLIWLFESRGERKVWIALLILLLVVVLVAVNCMDCVRF